MSKEETKNKETNGVGGKLLGAPGWWDALARVNVYGENKKRGVYERCTRVLAQTAYFARHKAASKLTSILEVSVHPEHIQVNVSADQTAYPADCEKPTGKKNGTKRKRK